MRFSPTKILQGLLCSTPILLLTLAACGGGGGGDSSASLAAAYTVGGAASGVSATGLVLRLNGGDDLAVGSGAASYVFSTSVLANNPYSVTVLTQPSSQLCSVLNASGTMPAYNVTDANVSCVTAYTIGGTISGLTGTGLVLQNNGGDNYLVPTAAGSFTFSTPVAAGTNYDVTVAAQPYNQTCLFNSSSNTGTNVSGNISSVSITCTNNTSLPAADPYVYAANSGSANVSVYTSANGVLSAGSSVGAETGPYSIAVDPTGHFAYVANSSANTLSAYSITPATSVSPPPGTLVPLDMDPVTTGVQNTIATGSNPRSIAIHPSGKFAYVTNYASTDNSVSAYSIDATGVLARIDSDGATAGNQTSIAARKNPIAIAIDPAGNYAYVANANDPSGPSVSVYSIDATTGALTPVDANGSGSGTNSYIPTGGTTPYALTVDPLGQNLYVVNAGSNDVSIFAIDSSGRLSTPVVVAPVTDGGATFPDSIAIHPTAAYAFVVNAGNNTVNVYDNSGTLPLLKSTVSTGSGPLSIRIDSTGQYVYVANSIGNSVSAYSFDTGTGVLTPVFGSPFTAGTAPYAVTTAR